MLDEVMKSLGPMPILQMLLGGLILSIGVWAVVRGLNSQSKDSGKFLEDQRAEWEAREQLKQITANSYKLIDLQQKTIESINRLTDNIWNRKQL